MIIDSTLLLINWTASPSQAFGQLVAMPAILVVVEILRTRSGRSGLLPGSQRFGDTIVFPVPR